MTKFSVNSESVIDSSTWMLRSATTIRNEVAQMMAHLTALQGSWDGQAAAAFQSLIADWSITSQQVDESLNNITRALSHAGQSYEDVELGNMRFFAR